MRQTPIPSRQHRLSTLIGSLPLLFIFSANASANVDVYGFVSATAGTTDSTVSWLDGGYGRFDHSASASNENDSFINMEAQVAIDWNATENLLFHFQGAAYGEEAASSVEKAGLIEAYARYQFIDDGTHALAASLGQKFFPTSLENIDDLWQSPYTLSYSAWNSWIAHEFRPIGLEFSYTHFLESGSRIGLRGSAFGGNDSSGAELAWGGWRVSNRITLLGEVLPLPDLITLRDGSNFAEQRDDGSKPFGPDLDDELGYALQLNYANETFKARVSHIDNQGDEALWRGEYAWRTQFTVAGFEWQPNPDLTVVTEIADGSTRMGPANAGVDVDFTAAYLLASYTRGSHRFTARYDDFDIQDRDGRPTNNGEDGDGFTLAYFYSWDAWRFGAEYTEINVSRPAAFESGFDPSNDGQQLSFEIRYIF